jgi:tetratricopeptide (TPR) repeat protein
MNRFRRWGTMRIFQNNKLLIFVIVFAFCVSISAQKINPLIRLEKNIDDGKLAESEGELFRFVVANPQDAKGFSLLAKLRLKQNRLNEAKSLANKALAVDLKLIPAKLTLALIGIELGETEQVRDILNAITDSEISDNTIRLNLAQTFALIGDCKKALEVAEKLPLKLKNNDALPLRADCFLQTNDPKNFASLIQSVKTSAKQNPMMALKFAQVLSTAAMHKETADLLRLVVLAAPKNANAWLLLAKSEIYLKDFVNAKNHLKQSENLQPNSTELIFVKSIFESEQGNESQALDLLEKALTVNPNNTEILSQFVVTAIRANQAGKAFRAAEKLINLKPETAEFIYLYGASSLQNNRLNEAESSLTKFLEMRPNDSRGCLALGLTYAAQPEKIEAARNQMQKCLTINPNNFEATYQIGLSYKTNGEAEKAIDYLEKTVKLSPNYASALRDLGAVYLQTSNELKARPVLEKAVSLNPNDADTHFQLSRLYNLIGERELAKKHLDIFQKLKNPKKDGM